MVITQGSIWWADLREPQGSESGFTRPVLVIQSNQFNRSKIKTVVVAILSSNAKLANAPGNVWLETSESGLPQDSVVVVSQLQTLDKTDLRDCVGTVSQETFDLIEYGLGLVFQREST
jgi:mRNA interferase MazF